MKPALNNARMESSLDIGWIVRHAVRMYFAPLTGAYEGIRDEYRRLDAEADQHRKAVEQTRRAGAPDHS